MKENIKTTAVRRRKFANILIKKGYPLLSVNASKYYPEQDVYIFEATPELKTDLGLLINGMRI